MTQSGGPCNQPTQLLRACDLGRRVHLMDHQQASSPGPLAVSPGALDYLLSLSSTPSCVVSAGRIQAFNLPFEDMVGDGVPLLNRPMDSLIELPSLEHVTGPTEMRAPMLSANTWVESTIPVLKRATRV